MLEKTSWNPKSQERFFESKLDQWICDPLTSLLGFDLILYSAIRTTLYDIVQILAAGERQSHVGVGMHQESWSKLKYLNA